ncbi:MAG: BglII/BstYI family type II restriction endonuclease [Candidatus Tyrphobacter sp.]
MKVHEFSYRYAVQILQHHDHVAVWEEILGVFEGAPPFIWPNKSTRVPGLDVIQQLMNTYFDRKFALDLGWEYHPLATAIPGSNLKADFRKAFGDVRIQIGVQFGNMARWYTDVFKFQAGYSAKDIHLGISAVPTYSLARRIDQNVVNFERARRELPAAELSITLPIVMFGLEPDEVTPMVDVSKSKFERIGDITGRGREPNRWRIVNGWLAGDPIEAIGPASDPRQDA